MKIENIQITSMVFNENQPIKADFRQEMIKNLLAVGFTQKSLAHTLQTSQRTINNILNGRSKKTNTQIFSHLFRLYCTKYILNQTN